MAPGATDDLQPGNYIVIHSGVIFEGDDLSNLLGLVVSSSGHIIAQIPSLKGKEVKLLRYEIKNKV